MFTQPQPKDKSKENETKRDLKDLNRPFPPIDLKTKLDIINFFGQDAYSEEQLIKILGAEAYAENFKGPGLRK